MIKEDFPYRECRTCKECVLVVKEGTVTCKKAAACGGKDREDG